MLTRGEPNPAPIGEDFVNPRQLIFGKLQGNGSQSTYFHRK